MPAFGEALSGDEIAAAIAHIRTFCADARWPRGELNLPRALFTEKAYPEDEAVITTTLISEGPDSISHEFLWEQRFGAVNQIEIKIPITRADLGEPDGWQSGTGDLGIGVKHTLRHSLERGAILAVGGELVPRRPATRPRASARARRCSSRSSCSASCCRTTRSSSCRGSLEFPNDSAFEDELVVRAASAGPGPRTRRSAAAWTPMIEVLAARELARRRRDGVGPRAAATSFVEHAPACPWRALGFVCPSPTAGTVPTEFVFYLLWDWFDGGVLARLVAA